MSDLYRKRFYAKDLYPEKAGAARFDFLCYLCGQRDSGLIKAYRKIMGIVIDKHPSVGIVMSLIELRIKTNRFFHDGTDRVYRSREEIRKADYKQRAAWIKEKRAHERDVYRIDQGAKEEDFDYD